ncbi:MAG: bifunctional glutamate N-acetyltransferase/amino-acid acetyltransferase ArgJ [Chitinivibrionales bacterium]|nr:bifunctional glutamate N-acetyltransferase/amino-acid acetyltransferase ArgJ [Chitinivibrionales bacterium]
MKDDHGLVIMQASGGITAAHGFGACSATSHIKQSDLPDLGLIYTKNPATAAGAFTRNAVRASCVDRNRTSLPSRAIRAIVCNSGNANACTGPQGVRDNQEIADIAAKSLGVDPASVLTASTGIIGEKLPMPKLRKAIPRLCLNKSHHAAAAFARAIMTTDTRPKQFAIRVDTPGLPYRIGGAAKGSGMIHPNMATMLGFITTDAEIAPAQLRRSLRKVVDWTFNNLTIDGDTSTNDMVLVLANGRSGALIDSTESISLFEKALFAVANNLCAQIAADGEGATKRIEINVYGAQTEKDARKIAQSVARSNLVKTAIFGNDPNWGRILCAIGYSGAPFSLEDLKVYLCKQLVCSATTPVAFSRSRMRNALQRKVVEIDIDVGFDGEACAVAHTCDLTYRYVKINAQYHT